MYGQTMNETREFQGRPSMTIDNGCAVLPKPKETNPILREMAFHVKEFSKDHEDYTSNIVEVVNQAIKVLEQRTVDLNEQIYSNEQDIKLLSEQIKAKANEQEYIYSQINRLKKLFN